MSEGYIGLIGLGAIGAPLAEMLYKEYGKDIKFGIVPPPMPQNASEQQIWDIVGKLLDTYPVNVYMGMDFGSDPRYYPYIYEASRKQSMRLQQN